MPLTKTQAAKLKRHYAVEDVEDEGMDEGRFFVHLKPAYDWNTDPHNVLRTKSFGGFREVQVALKTIKYTRMDQVQL